MENFRRPCDGYLLVISSVLCYLNQSNSVPGVASWGGSMYFTFLEICAGNLSYRDMRVA
jgi:hypothetical protein